MIMEFVLQRPCYFQSIWVVGGADEIVPVNKKYLYLRNGSYEPKRYCIKSWL